MVPEYRAIRVRPTVFTESDRNAPRDAPNMKLSKWNSLGR